MDALLHRIAVAALLAGSLAGAAWAQPSTPTTKETGNTLTGGAEATTTDKGTPGAPGAATGTGTQPQTSGSSATPNTLTGGAEGTTTDKGTPSGPATGSGEAAPAGTGTAGTSQQDKGTRQK